MRHELRVLVVDDDRDLREMLAQVLEMEGLQPESACDGREALEVLHHGYRPDVILLDLRMPRMSGWEFREAQLTEPDLAAIPVVVLTADRTQDRRAQAVLRPAGLFHKPLDVDAVIDALGMLGHGESPSESGTSPSRPRSKRSCG